METPLGERGVIKLDRILNRAHYLLQHCPPEQLLGYLAPPVCTREWIPQAIAVFYLGDAFANYDRPCALQHCQEQALNGVQGPVDRLFYSYLVAWDPSFTVTGKANVREDGMFYRQWTAHSERDVYMFHLFLAAMWLYQWACGVPILQDARWKLGPGTFSGSSMSAVEARGPTPLQYFTFAPNLYLQPSSPLLHQPPQLASPATDPNGLFRRPDARGLAPRERRVRMLPSFFYEQSIPRLVGQWTQAALTSNDDILLDMLLTQLPLSVRYDPQRVLYRLTAANQSMGTYPVLPKDRLASWTEELLIQYFAGNKNMRQGRREDSSEGTDSYWLDPLARIPIDALPPCVALLKMYDTYYSVQTKWWVIENLYRQQAAVLYMMGVMLKDGYLSLPAPGPRPASNSASRCERFFRMYAALPDDLQWHMAKAVLNQQRVALNWISGFPQAIWKIFRDAHAKLDMRAQEALKPASLNHAARLILGKWQWYWSLPDRRKANVDRMLPIRY